MLKLYTIPDTPMKLLLESIYFDFNGKTIKIPAWFAFDWPSIPRYLSFVYKPNDSNILKFSIDHDFLYSTLCEENNRKEADMHYAKDIEPLRTKILSYIGVRIWGRRWYKKDLNYRKYKTKIEYARKALWLNSLTK